MRGWSEVHRTGLESKEGALGAQHLREEGGAITVLTLIRSNEHIHCATNCIRDIHSLLMKLHHDINRASMKVYPALAPKPNSSVFTLRKQIKVNPDLFSPK